MNERLEHDCCTSLCLPTESDSSLIVPELNRRSFLRKSLAVGAGILGASCAKPAFADAYHPIDFYLRGGSKYENDFNTNSPVWTDAYNRKSIVKQAMYIVNRRFFDVENVAQNVYDVVDGAWHFDQNAWNDFYGAYPAMVYGDDMLWYQLKALRHWLRPAKNRSTPSLYIYSTYKPNENALAWGDYNKVRIKRTTGRSYKVEGNFEIYLNFARLGGAGANSDPYSWAGIIAHEMLHNLGHMHDASANAPQFQRRQINVFSNAVYYGNRKYRLGYRTFNARCGGRTPG